MEKWYYRLDFEFETAKEILSGELEGVITTKGGYDARIVCTDMQKAGYPILALVNEEGTETAYSYDEEGHLMAGGEYDEYSLILYVTTKPMYKHKKFDRVLVRNSFIANWNVAVFSHHSKGKAVTTDGSYWEECIPFNIETLPLLETGGTAPEPKKEWEIAQICPKCKKMKPASEFLRGEVCKSCSLKKR